MNIEYVAYGLESILKLRNEMIKEELFEEIFREWTFLE